MSPHTSSATRASFIAAPNGLGVIGVSLKGAVKLNYGVQGSLQGPGIPNEAGLGAFLSFKVRKKSVFFLDAQTLESFLSVLDAYLA
jgi:hypothetical protein